MVSRFPFKNLVFQGGGVKTFAYHGALRVLEEYGILDQIERVAGTSAGALLATLLSFRLSVAETVDLLRTVDYAQLAQAGRDIKWPRQPPKFIEHELDRVMTGLDAASRMVRRFGWFSHTYARYWLEDKIALFCQGNGQATFADFRRLGFRDVHIVATNLSTRSVEVFSAEDSPDVAVSDAVLLSGSIPLYFEAPRFDGKTLGQGDYYADGGVLLNYPLEVFDIPRYGEGNPRFVHGINWETLGCRLYTPEDCAQRGRPISSLISYATNLFETLAEAQIVAYENDIVDQMRTININNCGVSATDFELQPDESNPAYLQLVQAGETAAREYLERYRLPTDRFCQVRARLIDFLEQWRQ